jgi:hypothetical protein
LTIITSLLNLEEGIYISLCRKWDTIQTLREQNPGTDTDIVSRYSLHIILNYEARNNFVLKYNLYQVLQIFIIQSLPGTFFPTVWSILHLLIVQNRICVCMYSLFCYFNDTFLGFSFQLLIAYIKNEKYTISYPKNIRTKSNLYLFHISVNTTIYKSTRIPYLYRSYIWRHDIFRPLTKLWNNLYFVYTT